MPETKRSLKVFLCHASADKPKVRELYRTLKRRGVQPWLDAENLIPGQNWEVEIPRALLSSDAIIICLSPNSVDKEGYVQKEIKFALDKALEMPEGRIFIIPAKLEECTLPFSLRQYQAVNLYEKEGYTKLMKALKLRASQLERNTVELPKEGEIALEIRKGVAEEKSVESRSAIVEVEETNAERSEHSRTRPPRKLNTTILVALIGFVGTVIAALLTSPLIERWAASTPVGTLAIGSTLIGSPTLPSNPNINETMTLTPSTVLPGEITDNKGEQMILVAEGEFTMGNDRRAENEIPAHMVHLDGFYIDKYEVTNAAYMTCVNASVCMSPKQINSTKNASYYGDSNFNDYPVIYVDWYMAKSYCEWRGGRLPTEAEWEKAARGTDARIYPWNGGKIDCSFSNYFNGVDYCVGDTTPVGYYEKGRSAYGLYDMGGNVWEWVSSLYMPYPYIPTDGREDLSASGARVNRGGSWHAYDQSVRASARSWNNPAGYYENVGFRCAVNVNP